MSIEICIINPYPSAISNEKIKNCALKVISKDCSLLINKKNSQEDYFDLHSESINISKLLKVVEKNNSSDAFIIVSFEDIGVDTIRKITSKPIIGFEVIFLIVSTPISSKEITMKASEELFFSTTLSNFEIFIDSLCRSK